MSASPGGDFKIHGGKSASKLVVEAQWLDHSLYANVALLIYQTPQISLTVLIRNIPKKQTISHTYSQ